MTVIDAHVHLYPPALNADPAAWAAAHGEPLWAALCTRRRKDGRPVQGFPSVDELLLAMDAAGVGRAVLLGWYWEKHDTCAWHNRFLARCVAAHPDRLMAFAAVQVAGGVPEAAVLAELRQARDEGLVGMGEVCPPAQGYAYDARVFATALRFAAGQRWPVNVHVTDPASRPFPGRVETPREPLTALLHAHPEVNFILAHWAGGAPFLEAANAYYDTSASPLLYPPEVWRRVGSDYPSDRVILGSDYPLHLYPRATAEPEMARLVLELRAGLPASVVGAVGGGTLRTLLGTP